MNSDLPCAPPRRVSLVPEANHAVQVIRSFLGESQDSVEGCNLRQKVERCCEELDLLDLNYALYRCDQEERDDGMGGAAYEVPGAGSFVYCGLQGIMSMLAKVRRVGVAMFLGWACLRMAYRSRDCRVITCCIL